MQEILQIRFHGRGGQGAVLAAEILAAAVFLEGKYAQAFPFFGVERTGTPVEAYCRISASPIRLREHVYFPDYLIVQDETLLKEPAVLKGLKKNTQVLINSENKIWPELPENTFVLPASKLAKKYLKDDKVNLIMLGGFIGLTELVQLKSLKKVLKEKFSKKVLRNNLKAVEEAHSLGQKLKVKN